MSDEKTSLTNIYDPHSTVNLKDIAEYATTGMPQADSRPSFSLNNRLVLEAYKKEGLKSVVHNGFAMTQQKVLVKGLKVLMKSTLQIHGQFSIEVNPGDMAYIREEYLHSAPWAQKILQSDAVEGDFMIIDQQYIEFVVPK